MLILRYVVKSEGQNYYNYQRNKITKPFHSYRLDKNGELFCSNDHYGWIYGFNKKGEFTKIQKD